MDRAIAAKTVTYDFARLMEGAKKINCSEFADAVIGKCRLQLSSLTLELGVCLENTNSPQCRPQVRSASRAVVWREILPGTGVGVPDRYDLLNVPDGSAAHRGVGAVQDRRRAEIRVGPGGSSLRPGGFSMAGTSFGWEGSNRPLICYYFYRLNGRRRKQQQNGQNIKPFLPFCHVRSVGSEN